MGVCAMAAGGFGGLGADVAGGGGGDGACVFVMVGGVLFSFLLLACPFFAAIAASRSSNLC